MIEIKNVSKQFDEIIAVSKISMDIPQGSVFGLIGTNGAGKSTLLRLIAGILKQEEGCILVDGELVYENPKAKSKVFYLSDDAFVFPNASAYEMRRFYQQAYPNFQEKRFLELMNKFGLDEKRKISTFSKGMKKQLQVLLGVCANTKYLLCDETFDGLDPVMRQAVKSLFALEIMNREFTPIIASHNLRELEDICDHVGLLHRGGVVLAEDLEEMKFHIHKVQCVIKDSSKEKKLLEELEVMNYDRSGSLLIITARGTKHEIMERVQEKEPIFSEVLPLTLEEIFISEAEVIGYEIKNIIQ